MKVYTDQKWIAFADFSKLERGICPHCDEPVEFIRGPRDAMAQNILCPDCKMEFNAGPAGAQIIHQICPVERRKEIYGL